MPNNVTMDPRAAEAALRAIPADAGPEEVAGFLAGQPSKDLLSQAMDKFTNIESRVLLAKRGAPLLPALKKILTDNSCNFGHMKQLIEAASASPTDYELRYCMAWATWGRKLSAVQFLIGKGAPAAGESLDKEITRAEIFLNNPSLFTYAILSGNHEMVALFLQLDPAVINQTYGRNPDQHDAKLLSAKGMMALNDPDESFAALTEESKTALLSCLESRQAELIKRTSGSRTDPSEAIIFSVLAACIPGFISFVMYMSSYGDYAIKTAGLVFLGLAALCLLVGVVGAVSIAMHNRKRDQLNKQKEEVTGKIAELENQGVSQPSAPLVTPSHNNGQQSGNNGQPPAYTPPPLSQ